LVDRGGDLGAQEVVEVVKVVEECGG